MSRRTLSIIDAIKDRNLIRPFLADRNNSLDTWRVWMACLRALYGLPLTGAATRAAFEEVTKRSCGKLPKDGFQSALFLTGRRSGKSRTSAVIAAFEAVMSGTEKRLAPGEKGIVAVISPTKGQSRIVHGYIKGIFESSPILAQEVVSDTKESFELRNGIRIEVLSGDFKTIRGYTLCAAVVDEICFFQHSEECKMTDVELIRALKPALATTRGKLICISSPYARRGGAHGTWKKCFGNDDAKTLVIQAPSRTMNPTLPQSLIDEAMAEDMAAARSEYYAEWRDDVGAFIDRTLIERLVVAGRKELLPDPKRQYVAFVDPSGGRSDFAALAIAHRESGRIVVLDLLKAWRPPFAPYAVLREMADILKAFGLNRVTGDNYAAEFVAQGFTERGIQYTKAEKPKSQLYLELLPRLCSGEIELLNNETLVNQLAGLERRTRAGGRDIIDHPPGQHDDLANAVAGACHLAFAPVLEIGAFDAVFDSHDQRKTDPDEDYALRTLFSIGRV